MAQLLPVPVTDKKGKRIHAALNMDMTPMVDLGFLLITFFIFATTMEEKKASTLVMPKQGDPTHVAESKALTLILDKDNKVFVYSGKWEDAVKTNSVVETNYNVHHGLGSLIRERQQALGKEKSHLMLLIKPLGNASYQNIIDALDETLINNVERYAIVEASLEEENYIQKSTHFK